MAQGNVETPFLETRSFVQEERELIPAEVLAPPLRSPFVSVYELDGQAEFGDPEEEAYSTLVQELYDEEFDEALFELMVDARGLHEEHMVADAESMAGERLLNQHFSELIREAEATVAAFEREFGSRDASSLGETEVDAFAESYVPSSALRPEFEEFLGKWKKKIVGAVKKAGKFALKVGLGPVLNKIKALVKPLLNKVLQMAIGKLPQAVRPAAQQLAERIFKTAPKSKEKKAAPDATTDAAPADAATPEDPAAAVQAPAGPDVTEIQGELDQQLANLFLASGEIELELEVARARSEEQRPAVPVYADLDDARERFVNELEQLREGEDPSPYIQNFLPAVLPALRLGVRLVGRPKVVNFLANLLGKLIVKLIGPEAAPALSRAIVDTGLKLLSLEVSSEEAAGAAASSVAATVEEAARRVSNLPDYVLDDQELLEGFALQAFEQAAAANLPPVLSEAVYRERPDLLESQTARTSWIMLPMRRRKRYKKCGRTFKVRITPSMASEIESFEGPLSDYLNDQMGIADGTEVEAEVHLYETLPGTTLSDISREESEARPLHPLTPSAAGLLLGEPRMGRHVPPGTNVRNVGVGQRLYGLAIPGKRILTAPGKDGKARPRRAGGVRLTLDRPKDEIRIRLFMSEVRSQQLAVQLRRKSHAGVVATAFQKYIGPRLTPILRGERLGRIRVIQAGLTPGAALGAALRRLPAAVSAAIAAKIQEWVVSAFAEFAKNESQKFISAAEDTADGITLQFTIPRPAGLQQICKALVGGETAGLAEAIARAGRPDVRVEAHPGYARG